MKITNISVLATVAISLIIGFGFIAEPAGTHTAPTRAVPRFKLVPGQKFYFNSFVDCNMAEAWVGDTFRIFPGKHGEDPVWGYADDLKFADGRNADEAFSRGAADFRTPVLPKNVPPGQSGMHGAVWFETVYQDARDASGRTLPYDAKTGEGYIDKDWPQGLKGPSSPAAVCRIGIMKSTNGGRSWDNRGIFIEDHQPRMILKPHNTSLTFAGGVGDPSAVASGDYLYLFYGEYGYPGVYTPNAYQPGKESSGQCVSIARIRLDDLDNPVGKARRWDGSGFNALPNGIGAPITALQIPKAAGGGPAASPTGGFYWGPSVSWNSYLQAWVMLMGKVVGPSWAGSDVFISFNTNAELGTGNNAQQWSKPQLLLSRPGHFLWYPSLQPLNTPDDIAQKRTCLKLGREARLFVKDILPEKSVYLSEYVIRFDK